VSALLKQRLLKKQQPISFEERLQRAFPGSEWVVSSDSDYAPASIAGQNPSTETEVRPALGVIGGAKFDEASLHNWLRSLPRDTVLVTGNGRGAEAKTRELAGELGLRVDVPELKKDMYGTKAMDCQVEAIMCACGPYVLVGRGGRVTKARDWLKRARWGREGEELP